jgi:signal transduction histidine kinase
MTAEATATTSRRGLRAVVTDFARSARVRILGSVLALTAVGMTFAGAAVYAVQEARIDERIDADISQEVEEFARFQRTGIDPDTGEAFTTVPRLFEVALQRNVPNEHESILTFVGDRVAYYSEASGARDLVASEELRRAVVSRLDAPTPTSRFGSVDTDIGPVRFAMLPVIDGDTRGAWVVTYFTDRANAEFSDVMRTYVVVALLALVIVAVVGWFVAGALLRPLRLVRQTAQDIGETDLSRRIEVSGTDDMSALARTFNAMLDRLEGAFTAQRSFLDDAGHELRTPITVVRGNIELLDSQDPADVEDVRALVLDELDRMTRLVDDLTLLAKAERPDFVRPAPVDLGELTDDLLGRLPALGPRAWTVDTRSEDVISADGQRLTQAMLQLAANAVRATEDGAEIAVGTLVDRARDETRLWVRDTGVGVAPEDRNRIFQRFTRGAAADRGEGSGLGLSIVSAIAEAHGGSVRLESVLGSGSTFTLVLPYVPAGRPAMAQVPV